MFDLQSHGPDTFVGEGPRYPSGGLYGGQIVAQALRTAAFTVDTEFAPHSIRAQFIRGGDHTEPVRYEVDRIRNGRSFLTRRVVARQAVGAILNAECSFQRSERSASMQAVEMPPVPGPDGSRTPRSAADSTVASPPMPRWTGQRFFGGSCALCTQEPPKNGGGAGSGQSWVVAVSAMRSRWSRSDRSSTWR
jgi:acyl-CoA thioesterase II